MRSEGERDELNPPRIPFNTPHRRLVYIETVYLESVDFMNAGSVDKIVDHFATTKSDAFKIELWILQVNDSGRERSRSEVI